MHVNVNEGSSALATTQLATEGSFALATTQLATEGSSTLATTQLATESGFALATTHLATDIFALFLMLIISITSVTGNTLTVIAVVKNRSLRSVVTYTFVSNLAVADILTGAIVLPAIMRTTILSYSGKSASCLFGIPLLLFNLVSIQTLAVVAIDRYIAITDPLWYQVRMSWKVILMLICYTWCVGGLFAFAPALGWGSYKLDPILNLCVPWNDLSYLISIITFNVVIPAHIMIFCYSHIYRVARRHARQIRDIQVAYNNENPVVNHGLKKSDQKAATMLLIVIGVFHICWIPTVISLLCTINQQAICKVPVYYHRFANVLAFANSALNPVIYGVCNRKMRQAYKNLLCNKCTAVQDQGI